MHSRRFLQDASDNKTIPKILLPRKLYIGCHSRAGMPEWQHQERYSAVEIPKPLYCIRKPDGTAKKVLISRMTGSGSK